jgi:glycosyltransferase involved in cell wall biosynthesis
MAKILFLIGSLELGGTESQMTLLAEGLSRRGHKCAVMALDARGPLRVRLTALGIRVHDGGYKSVAGRRRRLLRLAGAAIQLWWLALLTRPDVLQAYLPLTNFIGAAVGRLAFVPTVITCRRALGKHQEQHPRWKQLDRLANRLSSAITVNSRAVGLDTMERDCVAADKLALIPNGVEFSRFEWDPRLRLRLRQELGLAPETPAILVVSNLIHYKGHADLIDAIAQLASRDFPAHFLLVGQDRGIGPALAEQAAKLGVSSRVSFLGQRVDAACLMAAADGFVLPSHQEGFSNALLEAMAAGLPIVATDVGGNGEALEGGRFGALVPPRDPRALAGAIDAMLDAPERAAEAGRAAARAVRERYDPEAMVQAHLALYGLSSAKTAARLP